MRGAGAFTLIELLVVISIIALLVSILLPSIQRAKQLAETLKCTTNLKAIATAANIYAGENDGYVPRDYWWNNKKGEGNEAHYFFAACLSEYIGGPDIPLERYSDDDYMYDVFEDMAGLHCPGVKRREYVVHYVANGVDFQAYRDGRGYQSSPVSRLEDAPNPAETMYIVEANVINLPSDSFGTYDIFNPNHLPFVDGALNKGSRMIRGDDMRHGGETTIVYMDTHAAPRELKAEEMPVELLNPLHEDSPD